MDDETWRGGLAPHYDYMLAERPEDPAMRESASIWLYDDQGRFGLTRIGIEVRAEAMPFNLILSQGGPPNYAMSAMLLGWGSNTGEASSPLRGLLATVNRDRGLGVANRGRYSNPALDAIIVQALGTVDDGSRRALLEQAQEVAMADQALAPILYQVNIWAARGGITYVPRADEFTLARFFTPAN